MYSEVNTDGVMEAVLRKCHFLTSCHHCWIKLSKISIRRSQFFSDCIETKHHSLINQKNNFNVVLLLGSLHKTWWSEVRILDRFWVVYVYIQTLSRDLDISWDIFLLNFLTQLQDEYFLAGIYSALLLITDGLLPCRHKLGTKNSSCSL